jgi:hypothetical protein
MNISIYETIYKTAQARALDSGLDSEDFIKDFVSSIGDDISLDEIKSVVDAWNEHSSLIQCKRVDAATRKAIQKALINYSMEECIAAVDNYATIMSDEAYAIKFAWNLKKFFMQSNAMPDCMDDGSKWVSYNLTRKQSKYVSKQTKEETIKLQDAVDKMKDLFVSANWSGFTINTIESDPQKIEEERISKFKIVLATAYPTLYAKTADELGLIVDCVIKNKYSDESFKVLYDNVEILSKSGLPTSKYNWKQALLKIKL